MMLKAIKTKFHKMMPTRRFVKKLFEPRKEFIRETRIIFLNAVAERGVYNESRSVVAGWRAIVVLKYAFVFVIVFILLTGGLVTYADYNNVSVNHPLYPLKRIAEDTQILVSPTATREVLNEKFAVRRINEIEEVIKKSVESAPIKQQQIQELKNDLESKIQIIEDKIEQKQVPQNRVVELCTSDLGKIANRDDIMGQESEHGWKFGERCKSILGNGTSTSSIIRSDDEARKTEKDINKDNRKNQKENSQNYRRDNNVNQVSQNNEKLQQAQPRDIHEQRIEQNQASVINVIDNNTENQIQQRESDKQRQETNTNEYQYRTGEIEGERD